jgi:hypothetical protein
MSVSVRSPVDGAKIKGPRLRLEVATSGFRDRCDVAGKPNEEGQGHYHVLLDKSLVNMFCTRMAAVSLENVKPGVHTLTVVPAQNDHMEIEKNARSIKFDYRPVRAARMTRHAAFARPASIKIVSPKAGATVSGEFNVVVDVSNFQLSCNQMGKPNAPGIGHWHLNFDTMTGPMMGMMTMAGMSCEKTLHASTAGLKPGSTHTLIALLADNSHAPLNPAISDQVKIKVK